MEGEILKIKALEEVKGLYAKEYGSGTFEDLIWSYADGDGSDGVGMFIKTVDDIADQFATLKTQQLVALNQQYKKQINELESKRAEEHRKNNAMAMGLLPREYTEQIEQLTAENERLREVFENAILTLAGLSTNDPASFIKCKEFWYEKAGINLTHKEP